MHILFISQYFHPEIGAASERISGFARNLKNRGHEITVITGFPNYPLDRQYPGYRKKLFAVEDLAGVRVLRVWLFTSKNPGAFARLMNYLSFMLFAILAGLRVREVDCVIATSGPIFAGLAGYLVGRMKKTAFIFDVRDIWPERIYAGTDIRRGWAIRQLEKLEMFLYDRAARIVAVTEGVKDNIIAKGIAPDKVHVVTNGVDTKVFYPVEKNVKLMQSLGMENGTFVVIYTGTLGLFQDLDLFVDCAHTVKEYEDIRFLIVGGGARRDELINKLRERSLSNVSVLPPVSAEELRDYINLSDVGVNANTDHPHNDMAIPVKMFAYMACGKPVVLANTGEVVGIVHQYNVGECVRPGDARAFTEAILKLYQDKELCRKYGEHGFCAATEQFSSARLAEELERKVLEIK